MAPHPGRTGLAPLGRPPALAAVVVVAGVAATYLLPDHRLFAFGQFVTYLAAAAGLTVLIGGSGQLSLGHAGLMATGAYAMALTQNALYDAGFTAPARVRGSPRFAAAAEPTAALWTLPVALLASMAAAVVVGGLLGLAAARLRGPYLAGLTLAFGLVVLPVSSLVSPLGGEQGLRIRVPRVPDLLATAVGEARWRAWVAVVATALVLLMLAAVLRGRLGREIRAVRDDEVAAALVGIPVARTRVCVFVLSAGAAGLAGGVYSYLTATVLPGYFGLNLSLFLVLAVVIGGAGSLAGSAWGTFFVVAVPIACADLAGALDVSPAVAARLAGNLPLALLGLALIVVTVTVAARGRPGGATGGPASGVQGVVVRLARLVRGNSSDMVRRPGSDSPAPPIRE